MDIREIQGAAEELKRLIYQRPYREAEVARQLQRWSAAGLGAGVGEQIAQELDDLRYELSVIRQASTCGDSPSHEQVVKVAHERINAITIGARSLGMNSR